MVGLLGLVGSSECGGETALEVLGLGCSGELWANLASFSSSDSILINFLGPSVWQDFFLFCSVSVLETSCAVGWGSHRAGQEPPGVLGWWAETRRRGRGLWLPRFAVPSVICHVDHASLHTESPP